MSQNLHALFTDDPVEAGMKHVKTQLGITLISLLRAKGWNDQQAAEALGIDPVWVNSLLEGDLAGFTIEGMLEMLILMGFTLDADFFPDRPNRPFRLGARLGAGDDN